MTEGSLQLRVYLRARRAGCPTENAAAQAGLSLAEARLTDQDEARGLLTHIDTSEMPHRAFQQQTEPAAARSDQRHVSGVNEPSAGAIGIVGSMVGSGSPKPKENDMARAKRKAADQVVEVLKPDFDLARRIYFNDIKPAISQQATHGQELSSAYKEIKKNAHIQPQAAKLAFKLVEMEESKRDDFLRSFNGLLQTFRIFMPRDLVDQAQGSDGGSNVVPIGDSPRPALATIPSDDSDLAGDDWHANLKEGDTVMVPVGEAGSTDLVLAKITFVEGDVVDVEYDGGGETHKASIPRGAVSKPDAGDDHHQIAAE